MSEKTEGSSVGKGIGIGIGICIGFALYAALWTLLTIGLSNMDIAGGVSKFRLLSVDGPIRHHPPGTHPPSAYRCTVGGIAGWCWK